MVFTVPLTEPSPTAPITLLKPTTSCVEYASGGSGGTVEEEAAAAAAADSAAKTKDEVIIGAVVGVILAVLFIGGIIYSYRTGKLDGCFGGRQAAAASVSSNVQLSETVSPVAPPVPVKVQGVP